jgi:hypothetical protein
MYNNKPRKLIAFGIGFLPFFLIMLKPIYLPALAICLLFILGRYLFIRTERKTLIWGFIGIVLSIGSIAGYCGMNYRQYGEFTLSKIKLNNSLANITYCKAYLLGQDEELIKIVNKIVENPSFYIYDVVFTLNNEFIDKYKETYKNIPKNLEPSLNAESVLKYEDSFNYSDARLNSFVKHSSLSIPYIFYITKQVIKVFLFFDIVTLIVFFELLRFIMVHNRFKKFLWVQFFCTLFIISFFCTIGIGGIDDWKRLVLPVVPLIFATFTIFFSFIFPLIKNYFLNEKIPITDEI